MSTFLTAPRGSTRLWLSGAIAAAALLLTLAAPAPASAAPRPTVVFVHGAFADSSGWLPEMGALRRRGYPTIAFSNPLRGVSSDSGDLRLFLSTIRGPIVLVGHSYGGAVITNAATGNPNVKSLVYIAAFAPEAGENLEQLQAKVSGGMVSPATLDIRPYLLPDGRTTAPEGFIKPSLFRGIFAADLPRAKAALLAATQRPVALSVLGEPSGEPAWKTIPSWYMVAGKDRAIGAGLEKFMAKRMGARTVVAKGASHAVHVSKPRQVTKLVLKAVKR
ncbi:MAG: alpha/beta hydrolase [Thermoleophilaceae bacterium]|nr:alpha/beta hydrolase [Thermoleophilaceae bacterium]